MLADLPQSVFAGILFVLFIHFKLIVPISYRLYKKSFWLIVIRIVILSLSAMSSLLTFYKKKYSFIPFYLNTGFYAHCFLRIFLLNFLYIEDLIECKKSAKKLEEYIEKKKEINIFYIMILGFLLIEWISTIDLMAYGYIMSNAVGLIYFVFWFIIRGVNKILIKN
jgi:hypothetical protein